MATPAPPSIATPRRWWWLGALALVAVVLVVAWPHRGKRSTPRSATAPSAAKPLLRPKISWGPDGWKVGARRSLGPIAVTPLAPGLVRVTGTVIDRATRKPVPDVEVVFADGDSEASTAADVAGRYSIDLRAGSYRPFVRGDGVITVAPDSRERLPARPRADQVAATRLQLASAIDLRASTTGVDLEVDRAGKVHGRVTDSAGQPIAGAVVRAFAADGDVAARPVLGTDVAETDAAGEFDLEVMTGVYRLDAFHDRYGGVSAVAMTSVRPGETAEAEIVMMAGCVIRGRVVRADGGPVGDGALERGSSDEDIHASYFPDGEFADDGSFVWSTTEAMTLYLRAWPWKSAPSPARRFECKDGARYDDVVFTVPSREPDLTGRVVTADGRPVPFAFVDIGGRSDGTMNQQERADADGNWAVYALPSGDYQVSATADGVGAVTVATKVPARGVELRMSGTGALTGAVAGLADGSFRLIAYACRMGDGEFVAVDFRRVVTVSGGRYRLDGVPACDALNFRVIHGASDVAMDATVPAGGTVEQDIDFPDEAPVVVRGLVRDGQGQPAAGVTVTAMSGGTDEPASTTTGADGRFVIEGRAGAVVAAAGPNGYASYLLPDHGPSTVDIELSLEDLGDVPIDD
ncbi:MAG: carboxypeptidase-like regulatory domain-containing protein [Kofleriaceae bacterium]